MKHRLKTKAGKAVYALRKLTSEPVFGVIKAANAQGLQVELIWSKLQDRQTLRNNLLEIDN
jgi:hypothetical protein